jgi:5-methylcytosine-specific restriction endonuclease McrA
MAKINWRQSPAYHKARDKAFAPYKVGEGLFRCVLCPAVGNWQVSHIKSAGAFPELKMEPLNLLPMCPKCHRDYEDSGKLEKSYKIEEILPGRMEILRRLVIEHVKREW